MAPPDRHTAPDRLTAYVEQVKEDMIAGVAGLLSDRRPTLDLDELGIVPLRAYSAEEVAELLGVARTNSIYEIPETELPRVRRIGRAVGYLGINILCYMHSLEPVDVAGAVEAFRARLLDDRPLALKPRQPDEPGKTRVL